MIVFWTDDIFSILNVNIIIKPAHNISYKTACVRPRRFRSACASAQSDQSSQSTVGSQGAKVPSGGQRRLIILCGRASWVFARHTCILVGNAVSQPMWSLTLSLPQAILIGFCKQRRSRWDGSYEPSHLDLRCLTFSLSILRINFFTSLLKKKSRRQIRLKFGTERVNIIIDTFTITTTTVVYML